MKVQRVVIRDFKVIKDLDVNLEGKSVFLLGENGKGKSSFIQAIKIALGNSKVIPEDIITGDGKVFTTINGEPYTFAFATKKGKLELSVILPNGLKETKKGIIGGIVGSLSFDINEFVKLSESTAGRKKQVEEFKKLLPAEFITGLKEFETKVTNLYDERTEVGRKMATLEGFIKESKLFGEDLKRKAVDVSQLNDELEKANASNAKIKDVEKRLEERAKTIEQRNERIEAIKAEMAELERMNITDESTQSQAKEWLKKHSLVDTSAIVAAINNASENNVIASQAEEHNKKLKQLDEFKESYGDLTVQIEVNKQAISDAIKDFDSPVEGLSFDDEKLIYKGIAVSSNNLSTSEIIELGIKMFYASNPECGLMFVEHANEIGQERLKSILDYAKKYDLQCFFEEVKRGQDELTIEFVEE